MLNNVANIGDDSVLSHAKQFWDNSKLEIITILSGLFLFIGLIPQVKSFFSFDLAIIAAVVGGYPIVKGALIAVIKNHDIKAGLLVSIALVAAMLIGEYFAAGEVAFIMLIGEVLENRTAAKAWGALKDLVTLVPETATTLTDGIEKTVSISEVKKDDIILVKAGQRVPVDGIIVKGQAAINQAPITGEPLAVSKVEGNEVYIGSLNEVGVIEVRATKVGEDTTLSRLIEMVRNAQTSKAPVQRLADRWATWLVPTSLGLALLSYLITQDIVRAVTILIVFCPCALVIATPTAIVAGIGNAAKRGIVIKDGQVLETAGHVDTVVFDKTGTLTKGKPQVVSVISLGDLPEEEVLGYAAICESRSEHQLAKAILDRCPVDTSNIEFDSYQVFPGQGVLAYTEGKTLLLGNRGLLVDQQVAIPPDAAAVVSKLEGNGETPVFLVVNGTLKGLIGIEDEIKQDAAATVTRLNQIGIERVIMLTGDNSRTASLMAGKAGISQVFAEQMPESKFDKIDELKNSGVKVAMIGDGINDAPALALADVGIAMGVTGTDIAVAASGITLMSAELSKVADALSLSRHVLRTIRQNLWASALINLAAVALAAFGLMGPIAGAIVHNVGSVMVVGNSARLIRVKE